MVDYSTGIPGLPSCSRCMQGLGNHCCCAPACSGEAGRLRIGPRRALFLPEESVLTQVVLGD